MTELPEPTPDIIWQPLDPTRVQIRLFYLDFTHNDMISGSLKIVDLKDLACDKRPPGKTDETQATDDATDSVMEMPYAYNALSYAWGPPEETYTILVNGHDLEVRKNLFDFLSMFRDQSTRRLPLWIDQICINQNDDREKESQIGLMGTIYSNAYETLVWLGMDPHEGVAFRCIQHCAQNLPDKESKHLGWDGLNDEESIALLHFCSLPYWERHWVAQELILSSAAVMMYGARELSWETLANLALYLDPFWAPSEYNPKHHYHDLIQLSRRMHRSHDNFQHFELFLWTDAAQFAKTSLCEKPCDKVYGLQALFGIDRRITVDYTKSDLEVYFAALEKWFEVAKQMLWNEACNFFLGSVYLAVGMKLITTKKEYDLYVSLKKKPEGRWATREDPPLQWDEVRHWINKYVILRKERKLSHRFHRTTRHSLDKTRLPREKSGLMHLDDLEEARRKA